jgi:hypothetical protein
MKRVLILIVVTASFASCSKSKGGKQLAEEVCECSKKANGLPSAGFNRAKAQADCSVKQGEAWMKIKNNQKESDEFNKALSICASEQIKSSFGK